MGPLAPLEVAESERAVLVPDDPNGLVMSDEAVAEPEPRSEPADTDADIVERGEGLAVGFAAFERRILEPDVVGVAVLTPPSVLAMEFDSLVPMT